MNNDILFSHQSNVPFFGNVVATIMFAISSKIPLLDNLPLTIGKDVKLFRMDKNLFQSAKFAMADLFASLLRLTAAPCAYWRSFFTFSHNACNVLRGRKLSLRHSIKHYETKIIAFISINKPIIIDFAAKIRIITEITK